MNGRITGRVRKRTWTTSDGRTHTSWEYIVNLDPKPITRGGYRLKSEADAALEDELSGRNNGTWIEPSRTSLAMFIDQEWLPMIKDQRRASTYDLYASAARLHILPVLGHLPLQSVRPKDVRDLYAKLRREGSEGGRGPLGKSSIHNVHTALHGALSCAVERELLRRNPADKAEPRMEEDDDEVVQFWTPEQVGTTLAEPGIQARKGGGGYTGPE